MSRWPTRTVARPVMATERGATDDPFRDVPPADSGSDQPGPGAFQAPPAEECGATRVAALSTPFVASRGSVPLSRAVRGL